MMQQTSDATTNNDNRPLRLSVFGTHIHQSNGYSKVVYELLHKLSTHPDLKLSLFGFQSDQRRRNIRKLPDGVTIFDAAQFEYPRLKGFGFQLVKEFINANKPDVLIIFNDIAVIRNVLNELEKHYPRPWAFKVILYVDQVYGTQNRRLLDSVVESADAVMVFSPSWMERLVLQGVKLPCRDIPHGLNSTTFYPVPRELSRLYHGFPEEPFMVLNLNRNQPRKRWDICLQAWALFVNSVIEHNGVSRVPPVRLIVGTSRQGAWNLPELYKLLLEQHSIPEDIGMKCISFVDNPQNMTDREINLLYNACDVGINTCDGEGFGLCNFEHAAVGKPQILPALGGITDIFDSECSLLIDPVATFFVDAERGGVLGGEAKMCSHVDFSNALMVYYKNINLRLEHGARCRKTILERYKWSDIANKTKNFVIEIATGESVERDATGHSNPSNLSTTITPEEGESTKDLHANKAIQAINDLYRDVEKEFSFPTVPSYHDDSRKERENKNEKEEKKEQSAINVQRIVQEISAMQSKLQNLELATQALLIEHAGEEPKKIDDGINGNRM